MTEHTKLRERATLTTGRTTLRAAMLRAYDETECFAGSIHAVEALLARTLHSSQPREVAWFAKDGWPLEMIIGRPIHNAIRILLHARGRGPWYHQASDPSNPLDPNGPCVGANQESP